jgi:hypothetical protein
MNAPICFRRPATCCILALVALASGCHSFPFARRTAPAPPPVGYSPSAGTTPGVATAPALGTSLDDIDARNRTDIAAQLGRPVAPGPATPEEVVAMTHAGVEPRFIICYINRSTNPVPVGAQDVIYLHQQGVNEQVIQAMLTPGSACSRAEVARAMPPRVIVVEDPWWPYYYPYGPRYGVAMGYGYYCR